MTTPPPTRRTGLGHTVDDSAGRQTEAGEPAPLSMRSLGAVLLICGALGFAAAAVLTVEKFWLLTNPFYTPSCSINATFSCGSVMTSPQAEAFGFPNPLLGIAGFAIVVTTGAALLAGGRFAGWYWVGLQVGATAAVVFVHWLMYQSVFVIGALCPYCMIVWAVTIPTFVYVTVHNLARHHPRPQRHGSAAVEFVLRQHSTLLAVWLLAVTAIVVSSMWLG